MVRKLCQDVGIPVSGTLTEEDIQYCMCKIDELTSKKIQALNEAQVSGMVLVKQKTNVRHPHLVVVS
jgi:hypothetical protein